MHLTTHLVLNEGDAPAVTMSGEIPVIRFGQLTPYVEINLGLLTDPASWLHEHARRCLALAAEIDGRPDTREPSAHHGFDERKASEVTS